MTASTKPQKPIPERPQHGDTLTIVRDDSPYGYTVTATGIWNSGDMPRIQRLIQNAVRIEKVRIINNNKLIQGANNVRPEQPTN